jgi:hypothetical protein
MTCHKHEPLKSSLRLDVHHIMKPQFLPNTLCSRPVSKHSSTIRLSPKIRRYVIQPQTATHTDIEAARNFPLIRHFHHNYDTEIYYNGHVTSKYLSFTRTQNPLRKSWCKQTNVFGFGESTNFFFFFFFGTRSICLRCTAAYSLIVRTLSSPPTLVTLDLPTFATRCLHVHTTRGHLAAKGWNCGRECWPVNFA